MANARNTAVKVLLLEEEKGAYSNITLNNEINKSELSKTDAAFASALVYGVLERKLTLDYIIAKLSSIPLKKLSKTTLVILRLAVYQILYMDKVPHSATVNEAVKLAKKNKQFGSVGFINGLLRSFLRGGAKIDFPDKEKNPIEFMEVYYSCPRQIINMFVPSYGQKFAEKILEASFSKPSVTVRVNTLKTTAAELKEELLAQGVNVRQSNVLNNALLLNGTGSVESLKAYQDGLFHVQDLSSQLCCEILGARPGERVLDVCSAPGGKSFTTACKMEGKGEIFSFDMYDHKVKLIEESAKRLGFDIISAKKRDALSTDSLKTADRVLCDVPCSGLGIIRRKPEIKYKNDLGTQTLPEIQYKILENSSRLVKPGGLLLYSTCTLNQKENRENAEKFLLEHSDYKPVEIELINGVQREIEEPENQLTILPEDDRDGFFISVFQKTGDLL